MTPARPLAASVAALGIAGVVGVPAPATAVPAPCERAERYAAQSGADLFRLNELTLTPSLDDPGSGGGTGRAPGTPPAPGDVTPPGERPTAGADLPGPAGGTTARPTEEGERAGAATPEDRRVTAGSGAPDSDTTNPSARPTPAAAAPGSAPSTPDTVAPPAATTVSGVLVGEVKSALVAEATPNSAAVARMVNGTGAASLTEPLVQQAPPTDPEPGRRDTPATWTGPLLVDAGTLTSHARWVPGMACGGAGKVTRAAATLRAAQIVGIDGDVLVAVPEGLESVSTTALERRAAGARTVAAATIGARTVELLNGAVTVRVVRPPTLDARMSSVDGGEVGYVPAALEVSGDGIRATTLDTAGDLVEFTIRERGRRRPESGRVPSTGSLGSAPPLTLPAVPGVPPVNTPRLEAAPVAEPGTHVRISLGDVRQAVLGHSIAARASAVRIVIDKSATSGYSGGGPATRLDLEMGVLEAAAVAPEPGGGAIGGVSAGAAGAGGGLPVTGPRVEMLALGGVLLLVGGAAAMIFGVRRRRFRA